MSLLGSIEAPLRIVQDWRSGLAGGGLYGLYAGDALPQANPLVGLWACPQCRERYYTQQILQPRCPDCDVQLQHVGTWDLTTTAWPWLSSGGQVASQPRRQKRWGVPE